MILKRFIGDKYFCGLDIGAQTIKTSLIEVGDNQQLSLLGVYESRTNGFTGNSVTDLGELSIAINNAVSGLSRKVGVKIRDVQLGVGGALVQKRFSTAVIPLLDRGSKVISHRDVERIVSQARLLGVKMDEVILEDFPQAFQVDDVNTAMNPIGLFGRKLEVQTLVMVVNNTIVKNLTKAVNHAGFDVLNLFFTTYAAAQGTLNDYQRRQGCVVVDIGSTVTDVLVYRSGHLCSFESFGVGGSDFTAAIVEQLRVSYDLAEDIKLAYASVADGALDDQEEVLIKRDEGYLPVRKVDINRSIGPVMQKFSDQFLEAMIRSGSLGQINVGIFLTGGGSFLTGLPERLEQHMNLSTKLAVTNFPVKRMQNAAKFLSAIGLAQAGFRRNYGVGRRAQGSASWASFMAEKLKELYQEYF